MGRKRLDPVDRPPLAPEADDSGLVVSFAVGPSGVGPVMGFGSGDFFPVLPAADPPAAGETAAGVEPMSGPNVRSGS